MAAHTGGVLLEGPLEKQNAHFGRSKGFWRLTRIALEHYKKPPTSLQQQPHRAYPLERLASVAAVAGEDADSWDMEIDEGCRQHMSKSLLRLRTPSQESQQEWVNSIQEARNAFARTSATSQLRELRGLAAGTRPSHWTDQDLVPLRGPEHNELLKTLQKALQPGGSLTGRDYQSTAGVGGRPQLARAWRIQNCDLWAQYSAALKHVQHGCNTETPKTEVRELFEQVAAELGQHHRHAARGLVEGTGLTSSVNEKYLLHSPSNTSLEPIVVHGFDTNFSGSNVGTAFGGGCYFAEDAAKSDQYAQRGGCSEEDSTGYIHRRLYGPNYPPPRAADGVFYVLLCRVVLGHSVEASTTWQRGVWAEGTGRRQLTNIPSIKPLTPFHSLLGTAYPRFREFVVFNSRQILPEYLLAYTRGGQPLYEQICGQNVCDQVANANGSSAQPASGLPSLPENLQLTPLQLAVQALTDAERRNAALCSERAQMKDTVADLECCIQVAKLQAAKANANATIAYTAVLFVLASLVVVMLWRSMAGAYDLAACGTASMLLGWWVRSRCLPKETHVQARAKPYDPSLVSMGVSASMAYAESLHILVSMSYATAIFLYTLSLLKQYHYT